jgi:predicted RNA binding protein YcfA (HicA-like mRNA interferase family)
VYIYTSLGKSSVERNPRKILQRLKKEGWQHIRTKGSHMIFKHPAMGFTMVPNHPGDVTSAVARSIAKAAGWTEK